MSTTANATSSFPVCSAAPSTESGSIPATSTGSSSYVVPTCIPEPSGNVTYTVSYTSSGTESLPFIVPLTASTNATATSAQPVETSGFVTSVTSSVAASSTVPASSNENHVSTTFAPSRSTESVAPETTTVPVTTSAAPQTEATSTPVSSSTHLISTSQVSSAPASIAANSTSVAPATTTTRSVIRPTVTITEIYTGPPAGTPSVSRTSTRPVTTSVAPVTTAEPITTKEPELTTSIVQASTTSEPVPSSSNTFSYYTETLTFPSTTILSIVTSDGDAFPTSFDTISFPISSVNDPSSTPYSSYVDSLSSSVGTPSPTLIGTISPSDLPTTVTTPAEHGTTLTTPPTSPTTSTSATLSALPAPEGSNSDTSTATTGNPSGVIAGGTVAGVVGVIVLAGVSRWVWKRGASERAVRRMYRDDMRQIRERTYGLEGGPGQWGRPAWRRGPGSSEGSV